MTPMSDTELKAVVASYGLPSESLQGVRQTFELPWEVEPAIDVALVEAFLSVRPD